MYKIPLERVDSLTFSTQVADFNNFTGSFISFVQTIKDITLNSPLNISAYWFIEVVSSGKFIMQTAKKADDTTIQYRRTTTDGINWTAWINPNPISNYDVFNRVTNGRILLYQGNRATISVETLIPSDNEVYEVYLSGGYSTRYNPLSTMTISTDIVSDVYMASSNDNGFSCSAVTVPLLDRQITINSTNNSLFLYVHGFKKIKMSNTIYS